MSEATQTIDLSVVVPLHDEEACIDELVQELLGTLTAMPGSWEVILVDDGSGDRTAEHL